MGIGGPLCDFLRRLLALVRAFLLDLYGDPEAWARAVEDAAEGVGGKSSD